MKIVSSKESQLKTMVWRSKKRDVTGTEHKAGPNKKKLLKFLPVLRIMLLLEKLR